MQRNGVGIRIKDIVLDQKRFAQMILDLFFRFAFAADLKEKILNLKIANFAEIDLLAGILHHFNEKYFPYGAFVIAKTDLVYNGPVQIRIIQIYFLSAL